MKNTTFRKKALLSSVAMLLVALVALGSATFAWFSSNKTVTANGMSVKAAAAQGLVITDDNWMSEGNSSTFTEVNGVKTLTPISLGYDATNKVLLSNAFYPAEVKKVGGGVWSTGTTDEDTKNNANFTNWTTVTPSITIPTTSGTESVATDADKYFVEYQVEIKSTGDTVKGVQAFIKYNGAEKNAYQYVRIALYDSEGNVVAVLGNEDSANAVTAVSAAGVPTVSTQNLTSFVNNQWVRYEKGLDVKEATAYKIRVWYEGQDDQCIDTNQQAVGSIEFMFTYDTITDEYKDIAAE